MNPADAVLQRIKRCGVIAVLVIDAEECAAPLARALLAGGVDVMELTLRTPAALQALRAIKREVPEMFTGAGTVLTPAQVEQSVEYGADFAVSPGLNPRVVQMALDSGLWFGPGVCTPSDVEAALELGCRTLKFFPAAACGGLTYLRALAAPYLHLNVQYIPLGGLNTENMQKYLSEPLVAAIGGSWLAPRSAIQQGDWETITRTAAEAVRLYRALSHPTSGEA